MALTKPKIDAKRPKTGFSPTITIPEIEMCLKQVFYSFTYPNNPNIPNNPNNPNKRNNSNNPNNPIN